MNVSVVSKIAESVSGAFKAGAEDFVKFAENGLKKGDVADMKAAGKVLKEKTSLAKDTVNLKNVKESRAKDDSISEKYRNIVIPPAREVSVQEKYKNIFIPPSREARAQEIKAIADKRIQMKKDIANARRRETNFINKEHRIKGKNLKSAEDSAKIIMDSHCTKV